MKHACGAKLPIIALVAGAFFDNAWWVAWCAYFVGILAIVCSGIILKKTRMFAGDPAPFVMELPAYHMPTVGVVPPLGWTQAGEGWKMAVAALSGLIAKENVVATFGVLFGYAAAVSALRIRERNHE